MAHLMMRRTGPYGVGFKRAALLVLFAALALESAEPRHGGMGRRARDRHQEGHEEEYDKEFTHCGYVINKNGRKSMTFRIFAPESPIDSVLPL